MPGNLLGRRRHAPGKVVAADHAAERVVAGERLQRRRVGGEVRVGRRHLRYALELRIECSACGLEIPNLRRVTDVLRRADAEVEALAGVEKAGDAHIEIATGLAQVTAGGR